MNNLFTKIMYERKDKKIRLEAMLFRVKSFYSKVYGARDD